MKLPMKAMALSMVAVVLLLCFSTTGLANPTIPSSLQIDDSNDPSHLAEHDPKLYLEKKPNVLPGTLMEMANNVDELDDTVSQQTKTSPFSATDTSSTVKTAHSTTTGSDTPLIVKFKSILDKRHSYALYCGSRARTGACSSDSYQYYCDGAGRVRAYDTHPECEHFCQCPRIPHNLMSNTLSAYRLSMIGTGNSYAWSLSQKNKLRDIELDSNVVSPDSNSGPATLTENNADVTPKDSLDNKVHTARSSQDHDSQSTDENADKLSKRGVSPPSLPAALDKRHDYFLDCGDRVRTSQCARIPYEYHCRSTGVLLAGDPVRGCTRYCRCGRLARLAPLACHGSFGVCFRRPEFNETASVPANETISDITPEDLPTDLPEIESETASERTYKTIRLAPATPTSTPTPTATPSVYARAPRMPRRAEGFSLNCTAPALTQNCKRIPLFYRCGGAGQVRFSSRRDSCSDRCSCINVGGGHRGSGAVKEVSDGIGEGN